MGRLYRWTQWNYRGPNNKKKVEQSGSKHRKYWDLWSCEVEQWVCKILTFPFLYSLLTLTVSDPIFCCKFPSPDCPSLNQSTVPGDLSENRALLFWSFFTSENYIKVSDTKEKIFIKPTISRCWNSKKRVQENTGLGGLIKCVQGRFFSSLGAQKACKPLKFIENHSDLLFPWAVTINIYLQELKVRRIKYLWMHFK